MADQETLLRELLETFRLEAQDHLDQIALLLISLEKEEDPAERARQVEGVFRRLHTLKGAAHAVNLIEVAGLCQELESLLAEVKRGTLELDRPLFDRLHEDLDLLALRSFGKEEPAHEPQRHPAPRPRGDATALPADSPEEPPPSPAPAPENPPPAPAGPAEEEAAADMDAAHPSAPVPAPPGLGSFPPPEETVPSPPAQQPGEAAPVTRQPAPPERREAGDKGGAPETVRVPTRLLESLLLQAEELASTKLAAGVLIEELSAAGGELRNRGALRSRALELAGAALRNTGVELSDARLATVVQELCDAERRTEQRLRALELWAEKHLHSLRTLIDPLLGEMKKLHLIPFATLSHPFAKVVRDLGRELGKEADLTVLGGELEVDRRILGELKEPLLHILRNIMDHGIEPPPRRAESGKPPRGRIAMALRLLDANHAEIAVSDDGAGINPAKVKGTAVRLELVSPEAAERMADAEALQLIFESGFSTSPMITSLSGRGVGLAIVREALEKLGGHVTVESSFGAGCQFRLTIPLSFALIRGLQLQAGGRDCILPAASVALTARVPRDEIRTVENRDTVLLNGELFSLVGLSTLLGLAERPAPEGESALQVVLLSAGERRIALAVDQVVGVQEVLVKPLGSQLSRVRNVAGATVLGNGRVVPILNVNDLIRSALTGAARPLGQAEVPRSRPRQLSVLVAEDSITSRTLLKNILEASGYQVATAIDGADALSQLKTGSFDAVVSDVEMPRLDGFGLTAAIRGESRLAELPVILVTGLESRSDRERGIEVGANAYVVKSSFDQGNLVEVIQKLTGVQGISA